MPRSAALAIAAEIPVAPLARFAIAPENPRSIRPRESIETLAANLKANGQLTAVICYEEKTKLWITCGGTRFLAAQDAGLAGLAYDVQPKEKAIDAGLAEQEGHAPLHPADQALAFKAELARAPGDTGAGGGDRAAAIKTIANKVGKTERFVEQRLALADLHPPILKALRDDKITVHVAEAWANADVERQEDLWKSLSASRRDYLEARDIKDLIDKADLDDGDRLIKFVGRDAIREAGGAFRRDLFAVEGFESWEKRAKEHVDRKLVQKLAREKLAEAKVRTEKEGWGEVETTLTLYRSYQLQKGVACSTKEAKAKKRVRISIGETGRLVYERGLPKKADKAKAETAARSSGGYDYEAERRRSDAHQRLTGVAECVVGRSIGKTPGLALACVAAALARDTFDLPGVSSIDLQGGSATESAGLASDTAFKAEWTAWRNQLKPHAGALEKHLLTYTGAEIDSLLACVVACSMNLNEYSPSASNTGRRAHLTTLAKLAGVDVAAHESEETRDAFEAPLVRTLLGLPPLPKAEKAKPAKKPAGKK